MVTSLPENPMTPIVERLIVHRVKTQDLAYLLPETDLVFVWGILSADDLCAGSDRQPNIHTMNDLELTYDTQNCTFHLGVETIYYFGSKVAEKNYYFDLLRRFASWLISVGELTNETAKCNMAIYHFFNKESTCFESLSEAYYYFKFIVENHFKEE